MKILHKLFASLAAGLLFTPAALYAQGPVAGVIVIDRQGNHTEIPFANLDRINLSDTGIKLITSDGAASSTSYTDLDRIMVGAALSGVGEIAAEASFVLWPSVTDGIVHLKADKEAEVIVTSMSGAQVVSASLPESGSLTLDLSPLTPSVYIVCCGDNSVKIIKK